jgi:hypothetical protein
VDQPSVDGLGPPPHGSDADVPSTKSFLQFALVDPMPVVDNVDRHLGSIHLAPNDDPMAARMSNRVRGRFLDDAVGSKLDLEWRALSRLEADSALEQQFDRNEAWFSKQRFDGWHKPQVVEDWRVEGRGYIPELARDGSEGLALLSNLWPFLQSQDHADQSLEGVVVELSR